MKTELVFILDRSGSMCGLEKDTIGGFNSLIEKQKKEEGEATVTCVLFDDEHEMIYDREDLNDISPMTDKEYYVRGCTALYDAIGSTIQHIELIHKHIRKEDVPEKTIFVITTDGLENSSREFSVKKVKQMIEKKKETGWEFLFLGANLDAIKVGRDFGISEEYAVRYECDPVGTQLNYTCVSKAIGNVRKGKKLTRKWKEDIEADFESRHK